MASATRFSEAERKAMEAETRVSDMIAELGLRQARTDARLEEMMQAIAAINLQNQKNKEKEEPGDGEHGDGENKVVVRNDWGKSTRFEFPKFVGEGFEGWVMRSEYFFEVAEVAENEKVRIAALHLEGKAPQWHRGYVSLQGEGVYADWGCYIGALATRFGVHAYEDPLADLRDLKQISSLQSYMDAFDELYPRTGIKEDHALSFFLSGLIDELQMPVRMFKPLVDAYALAKLQELTVRAMCNRSKGGSYNSSNKPLTVTATSYKPSGNSGNYGNNRDNNRAITTKPGTRLTSKEIEERGSKGLCY